MDEQIRPVFLRRFPRQMTLGGTRQMTFAARMGCLVSGCRGFSIDFFANEPGDDLIPAIIFDLAVPTTVLAKWPRQAVVAIMGQDDLAEILEGSASVPPRANAIYAGADLAILFARETERVTKAVPARVMGVAPTATARAKRLAAAVNRAYPGSSHFSLSSGCFGQNPSQRSNARRVRCVCTKSVHQKQLLHGAGQGG